MVIDKLLPVLIHHDRRNPGASSSMAASGILLPNVTLLSFSKISVLINSVIPVAKPGKLLPTVAYNKRVRMLYLYITTAKYRNARKPL